MLPCINVPVMHPVPMYIFCFQIVTLDDRRDTLVPRKERTPSLAVQTLSTASLFAPISSWMIPTLCSPALAWLVSLPGVSGKKPMVCWKSIWKASSELLAECYSGRKVGLSLSFSFSESKLSSLALAFRGAGWKSTLLTHVEAADRSCLLYAGGRTFQNEFVVGSKAAGSILMHLRPPPTGSPDNFWDLSSRHDMMRASCTLSVAALLNALAPLRPVSSDPDALLGAWAGLCPGSSNTFVT